VLDDAGLRVERGGWGGRTAGQFAVTSPAPKTRADRRWLDGWLIQVGRLQVERFVPVPAAPPSDARHLVITPLDEQAEPAELVFGGEGCGPGTILVTRRAPSPDAGCVPAETADAVLGLSAERLRDQHVVGTAKDDIVEILWRAPDGPEVELARIESGWNMRKPVAGPAESEPVAELLDRMIELEGSFADGEPDLEALGIAPPRAEVVLRGLPERGVEEADQREERIEVGAARDGQVALRRVDDGRILFVSEEDGRFFLPRPSALRSTQILEVSLAAVRGLRLDCKGRKQHVTRLPAGSWTLEEPKTSLSVDVGSVGAITENLRQLKALRWIAERPAPAHELDEPWCKVTLESEEGGEKRRHTLLLGAPTQGGYFAKQSDAPAVFVAPKGLGAAAQEWLVSRSWLMTDEATIRKVTLLGRDGARREVERRGGAWSDRALGRTVEAVLGQLLAEAVLSLGRGPEKGFDDPTLRITIETDDGERRELVVGRGEVWKNTSVFLVRDDRVDATFAVAKSRLELLLDAL
ncbi:MAG: DUF4340 domain-containing protein, partial [Myxococcales bacterium]|nr:DUF4340 domain-containing protein [Myxococcales bacterium]